MREGLISAGFILVFIGMILIIAGTMSGMFRSKDTEVRGGGVVLIGPIPIIFGTDSESVKTIIILAIVLIIAAYLFFSRLAR